MGPGKDTTAKIKTENSQATSATKPKAHSSKKRSVVKNGTPSTELTGKGKPELNEELDEIDYDTNCAPHYSMPLPLATRTYIKRNKLRCLSFTLTNSIVSSIDTSQHNSSMSHGHMLSNSPSLAHSQSHTNFNVNNVNHTHNINLNQLANHTLSLHHSNNLSMHNVSSNSNNQYSTNNGTNSTSNSSNLMLNSPHMGSNMGMNMNIAITSGPVNTQPHPVLHNPNGPGGVHPHMANHVTQHINGISSTPSQPVALHGAAGKATCPMQALILYFILFYLFLFSLILLNNQQVKCLPWLVFCHGYLTYAFLSFLSQGSLGIGMGAVNMGQMILNNGSAKRHASAVSLSNNFKTINTKQTPKVMSLTGRIW